MLYRLFPLTFLGRNASRGHLFDDRVSGGTQAVVICSMTGSRLFLTGAELPFPVEVERKT
ncbi:Hypothetical protein Eab7_2385 [Exiguobacterium antarcticum B7]|nr:Hypothetical protein Eab7_2385 [Exiguobacterium antarcticum B7]